MSRPAELPMTGVEVTPLLLVGLGAAALGFVLLLRSRSL
jgi:LPXTG-motif cell wall-anchored protein